MGTAPDVRSKVVAPAIAMIVVGTIGLLANLLLATFMLFATSLGVAMSVPGQDKMFEAAGQVFGVLLYGVFAIMAGVMIFGAVKMKNLESYPMSIAACIIAIIPCYQACCILGIPFGIWGLVMLLQDDVKAAFRMKAEGQL
jgi:hypothetical protein